MPTTPILSTDFIVLHYDVDTTPTSINLRDGSINYTGYPEVTIPIKEGFNKLIVVNRSNSATIGVNIHTNGVASMTPTMGTVLIEKKGSWEVARNIQTISLIAGAATTPVMLILTRGDA